MPKQVSGDELDILIEETIKEIGATSPKDMGRVMGELTKKTGGNFDKAYAAKTVKEKTILIGLTIMLSKDSTRKWSNKLPITLGTISIVISTVMFVILSINIPQLVLSYDERMTLGIIMVSSAVSCFIFMLIACIRYALKPKDKLTGSELKYFNICTAIVIGLLFVSFPITVGALIILADMWGVIGYISIIMLAWAALNNTLVKHLQEAGCLDEDDIMIPPEGNLTLSSDCNYE